MAKQTTRRFRAALCVALGLPQATSENDVLSRVAVIASAQRDVEQLLLLIQEQRQNALAAAKKIEDQIETLKLPVQEFGRGDAWRPLTADSYPEEGQLVALWSAFGYHEIKVWRKTITGKFTHWRPETRPAPESTRIDDQDVSVRFANLCERAGINTLEDLAQRGEDGFKGFAAKMIKEARALLAKKP